MANEEIYNRLENFAIYLLKQNGDIREKGIHYWHLADDITASGLAAASGVFEELKLDGPTTPGYVWTARDVDGWGEWRADTAPSNHASLINLNWSAAGHTIDASIIPTSSGAYDLGSPAIPFDDGYFNRLHGDGSQLTGISTATNFLALTDTPNSYVGFAASGVRVNSTQTGLEFYPTGTGGGGGAGSIFYQTFTNASLISGILTVTHNLDLVYVVVQVYDNNKNLVIPDEITLTTSNSTTIDISSHVPITGTWAIVISAGGEGKSGYSGYSSVVGGYTLAFTNSNLVGGLLSVSHGLGYKYASVEVSNGSDNKILPDGVTFIDSNNLSIDLLSFGAITGTWHAVINVGSSVVNGSVVSFTYSNLVSGVLTINHGLSNKYNIIQVFDNNDKLIVPDEAICVSTSTATVDLNSYGVITGTWHAIIRP